MADMFKTPSLPKPKPVAPMANTQEIERSAMRRSSRMSQTSGAQSTILATGGRETLGA